MSARAAAFGPDGALKVSTARARAVGRRLLVAADAKATWLALGAALVVVGALYGRALGFSFLFDDTFDLARTEQRGYWQLLSSSEGYQYYRPLPFLIWKFLHDIQGYYSQSTLHLLPIIAHALAGWLLFVLLRRLGIGFWALTPALLFLTYPFAYQSVPIVVTLFHPLTGAAILASLVLYERARLAKGRRHTVLHVFALAATLVALWSHESGVVILAGIVGLEAFVGWRARSRRSSAWLLGHVGAVLLFLIVWARVERAPFAEENDLGDLHANALFWLQGVTYPVSAQIVWLDEHTPIAPGIVQAGLFGLWIVVGAFNLAAARSRRPELILVPLVALAAALVAFAPAMLRLTYRYVEDAPRLLYLVGMGTAVLWGLLPMLDFGRRRLTLAWRVVTCLILLGVVVQSWRFVNVRMTMFEQGTRVVRDVVTAGETYRGQRVLVVNAPSWFSLHRYEYDYGHLGVQLMPSYIGLDRVIYTSSREQVGVDARSVSWNHDVSGGVYPFGPHGPTTPPEETDALLREGRELLDVRPLGERFIVRDVGRLLPERAERRSDAPGRLDDRVWLSAARAVVTADGLVVYFSWHVINPTDGDYDAIIELRDESGATVARYSGLALAGVSAPRLWRAGDRIDDSVLFVEPPAGHYSVLVGLQRVGSEERMPALLSDGRRTADDLVPVGEIAVR
jgi:hypothetical protein